MTVVAFSGFLVHAGHFIAKFRQLVMFHFLRAVSLLLHTNLYGYLSFSSQMTSPLRKLRCFVCDFAGQHAVHQTHLYGTPLRRTTTRGSQSMPARQRPTSVRIRPTGATTFSVTPNTQTKRRECVYMCMSVRATPTTKRARRRTGVAEHVSGARRVVESRAKLAVVGRQQVRVVRAHLHDVDRHALRTPTI